MLVVLVKEVSFVDLDLKPVVIPADTMVKVDSEGVATFGDYDFDLEREEYSCLQ